MSGVVAARLALALADGALPGLLLREEDLPADLPEGPGRHLLALLRALDDCGGPEEVLEEAARLLDSCGTRGSRRGSLSARGGPRRTR